MDTNPNQATPDPNAGLAPPIPGPDDTEGAEDLARPSLAPQIAQNQIAAGQVNQGGSKQFLQNAVASVTAALAGFGAAGKVAPGQGALAGVGAAARQKQERDDQQRQQQAQNAQRQQQIDLEKQRVTQEQSNADREYQLRLGENARQQANQVKQFAIDDQRLKLSAQQGELEKGRFADEHMEFLQKQSDYLDTLSNAGGGPAKINGATSPAFQDYGEMAQWAKDNKVALNAHENGYIDRPVHLPDGTMQIWQVPDKAPEWHTLKDAQGQTIRVFGDTTSLMATEHSIAETRLANAQASKDYEDVKATNKQLDEDETARGARAALDAATDPATGTIDKTKIKPGQLVQVRKAMMDQWTKASGALIQAQKQMQADPEFFDAQADPKKMTALQDKYGVTDALEYRNYARGAMMQLDAAPYAAGVAQQTAQAAANLATPEGAAQAQRQQVQQQQQEEQAKQQREADLDQLHSLTTENTVETRGRQGAVKTANPTFNEGLSKLIAAHPNWTDDEKIRAMKAYVGANGGGGNATGTHQPGDIVTQNGVQYRVTAVDANGKPTAAQPVQ